MLRTLLVIAVILFVIWIIARLVGFITGLLLNLFWIAAVILFVIWLIGFIANRT